MHYSFFNILHYSNSKSSFSIFLKHENKVKSKLYNDISNDFMSKTLSNLKSLMIKFSLGLNLSMTGVNISKSNFFWSLQQDVALHNLVKVLWYHSDSAIITCCFSMKWVTSSRITLSRFGEHNPTLWNDMDWKNFKYGHFLRSVDQLGNSIFSHVITQN